MPAGLYGCKCTKQRLDPSAQAFSNACVRCTYIPTSTQVLYAWDVKVVGCFERVSLVINRFLTFERNLKESKHVDRTEACACTLPQTVFWTACPALYNGRLHDPSVLFSPAVSRSNCMRGCSLRRSFSAYLARSTSCFSNDEAIVVSAWQCGDCNCACQSA